MEASDSRGDCLFSLNTTALDMSKGTPEKSYQVPIPVAHAIGKLVGSYSHDYCRMRLAELSVVTTGTQEAVKRRLKDTYKLRILQGDVDVKQELCDYIRATGKPDEYNVCELVNQDFTQFARKNSPFDYILVCDFEATCERDRDDFPHEIIEFPILLLNTRTQQIEDQFHEYVRPLLNPKLSEFCTELTGITQNLVDHADPFPVVLQQVETWLAKHKLGTEFSFAFLTDGPWDFRPAWSTRWINVRKWFGQYYHQRGNIEKMLKFLKMPFEGRQHSGIDDAKNIAKIALRLMQDGCELLYNDQYVAKKM